MSTPISSPFQRLKSDAERKTFYAELKGPTWWLGGSKRSPSFGWVDVFEKSDGKCVYCSRDLAASTDALAESTEEHLVPRSLLEANRKLSDNEHNMAVCCAGCNGLKNESVPPRHASLLEKPPSLHQGMPPLRGRMPVEEFSEIQSARGESAEEAGRLMSSRSQQLRLVAQVEQLLALVDALETQLAASRATAAKLLDALVAELNNQGG